MRSSPLGQLTAHTCSPPFPHLIPTRSRLTLAALPSSSGAATPFPIPFLLFPRQEQRRVKKFQLKFRKFLR
jgi:hypothetical protein